MNSFPFIEKARAKINLTLHVGPPTADGYHPLQSLVVFADIGDELLLYPATGEASSLSIEGPFADGLETDNSNLILKMAQFISAEKFDFKLTKNLPIASGIGGGSADAAATARLIERATNQSRSVALEDLGADIPVCVSSRTSLMEGKGEVLTPLRGKGTVHAVLVNPGVAVSTGKVFSLFDQTHPKSVNIKTSYATDGGLLELARAGRNELQDVAISIAPDISTGLDQLSQQDGCELARMSGSGATCFGLFESAASARTAQKKISDHYPEWWCVQTVLGDPE